MLDVSATWHAATREQFRYQAYLTAKLEVIPPGLRENTTVVATDTFEQSTPDSLVDGSSDLPYVYATLEPNRWALDGTHNILAEDVALKNWWSDPAVDESQPTLSFDFGQPYNIPGAYIVWDNETNSWPTSFKVTSYDSTKTQLSQVTITGVNSVSGFYESIAVDNVRYLDIVILEWGKSAWRARVAEVTFGLFVSFESKNNGRITSANLIDRVDPLARTLPTHTASLTLRNLDKYFDPNLSEGLSKYIARQQILKLQWHFTTSVGIVESAPEVLYLIDSFNVPPDSKEVQISTTSRLASLTSDFVLGTYTGASRTLSAIAQYVLENSGIQMEYDGQNPWAIANKLSTFTTTAPIPAQATNALLQLIAAASCTWLGTRATDGFIEFAASATIASDYCAVDKAQELGDPEVSISDRLRTIRVGVYSYSVSSTVEDLGTAEYVLSGTNIVTIKYSREFATEVSATVTGATLQSAQYYVSYAVLKVTAAVAGATVSISLKGKEILQNVSYLETYRDSNVANGIDVTVENLFVTSASHALQLSAYVQKYYSKQIAYKAPYLGYPQLEAGDRINFSTVYGALEADVTSNTIDFNGAWTGTVEVV